VRHKGDRTCSCCWSSALPSLCAVLWHMKFTGCNVRFSTLTLLTGTVLLAVWCAAAVFPSARLEGCLLNVCAVCAIVHLSRLQDHRLAIAISFVCLLTLNRMRTSVDRVFVVEAITSYLNDAFGKPQDSLFPPPFVESELTRAMSRHVAIEIGVAFVLSAAIPCYRAWVASRSDTRPVQ